MFDDYKKGWGRSDQLVEINLLPEEGSFLEMVLMFSCRLCCIKV